MKHHEADYLTSSELEGIMRAHRDPNYAFLVEQSYFWSLGASNTSLRHSLCDFSLAQETFLTSMYALPFRRDSPYLKEVSLGWVRIGSVHLWM